MNETLLNEFVRKYQKYLEIGERNLAEFKTLNKTDSANYRIQNSLVTIWKMVLNDFQSLTDKKTNDSKNK